MTLTHTQAQLAAQATVHLDHWRRTFGPLIACPVVHLKSRFRLSLDCAEALAAHLHDAGVWCLRRTPSGLACAEISVPPAS